MTIQHPRVHHLQVTVYTITKSTSKAPAALGDLVEVELVALAALHHPQAVVPGVREHRALLPLNLVGGTMVLPGDLILHNLLQLMGI